MSQKITILLAQPITLVGAMNIVATDQVGAARTVSLVGSGTTKYVAPVVASVADSGDDITTPKELFQLIATALSVWTVTLDPSGRTKVTYTGTGTGQLGACDALGLLGFAGGIGPLSEGASALSAYPAVGLFAHFSRSEDTGWQTKLAHVAVSQTAVGQVYGFTSGTTHITRSMKFGLIPKQFESNATGEFSSPMFPSEFGRLRTPVAPSKTSRGPWSLHELVCTAMGQNLGAFFGDSASFTAGSKFEVVQFAPDQYSGDARVQLSAASPTWDARREMRVALTLINQNTV